MKWTLDSMTCFGHPVAAPERFLVAVRCNSFLLLFSFSSMLFLLLWLWWWWPVLVILWRHFKGARWRCGSIACLLFFFVLYFVFVVIYVVFVVVVVVASVGHPVAASQRCSVAVLKIQLYCPVCPPSSLLLSSPRNHHHHHYIKQSDACLHKKGLIEKDRREISTTFAPSRSIDLFDVDVTCVFDPRYY